MEFFKSDLPLMSYVRARSAIYSIEGLMKPVIDLAVLRRKPNFITDDMDLFKAARSSLDQLLQTDVQNIETGVYPRDVLFPENPLKHLLRLPRMFVSGIEIALRRKNNQAHVFSETAKELMDGLPDYYKRNFHYQGDGYLSAESADLYDHQVDVLFAGAADAMRRSVIAPLKEKFGATDGQGLRFLELGSGTGRSTRFVRLAFPKAKIVSCDLSTPYLKKAQHSLRNFSKHDFIEADAAKLPFLKESFDAVYSVFLFHELPMDQRVAVIEEAKRVLKTGGFFGLVDSLQIGDRPEFDEALKRFPVEFHEPFYKNYADHPMEELMRKHGLKDIQSANAFFSKVVTASL